MSVANVVTAGPSRYVLWMLSKSTAKYGSRFVASTVNAAETLLSSSPNPPTNADFAAANRLFHSVIVGDTAEPFLFDARTHTTAQASVVFLLDNDVSNAGEVIPKILHDVLARERIVWIHSLSAGVDMFHIPTWRHLLSPAIPFSNARGVFASILAEHVLYSILYFNRFTWKLQDHRRRKVWDRFAMVPLQGQRVGIVGYGNIGQACARNMLALGMDVVGLRRTLPPQAQASPSSSSPSPGSNPELRDEYGVKVVVGESGLQEVLECDVVVNIMPLTSENRHFFNAHIFARMKRTAIYINIGRGATQVEADLAAALNTGVIRGAAVDVFEVEPLPESSPLWTLNDDRILLTSHNADISQTAWTDTADYFLTLAERFVLHGKQPEYLLDVHGKGY